MGDEPCPGLDLAGDSLWLIGARRQLPDGAAFSQNVAKEEQMDS